MRRYYRDPEQRRVAALIEVEIAKAREAEKQGGWIIYLIRDPRGRDRRGNTGVPIYVGQTKEFPKRVRSRFDKCEKLATKKDSIEKRVADLLHLGWVPSYEVLERTPTRLSSLVSETNWARECIKRGYDITNQWPEQRMAGPPVSRADIPLPRIWEFSLREAIEDGILLRLACRGCGLMLDLDFSHFLRVEEPPTELYQIKANSFWKREPCTGCGAVGQRYATLRVA